MSIPKAPALLHVSYEHINDSGRFLIESESHTVLYTGDIRAEPHLINSLRENPILKPYIAYQQVKRRPGPKSSVKYESAKVIDEIYLDTAAAMTRSQILPKVGAIGWKPSILAHRHLMHHRGKASRRSCSSLTCSRQIRVSF